MRTSILAVALAALVPAAVQAQSPGWQKDYATAYRAATSEQRPMAVVFGTGADGLQQIVGGGSLTGEAKQELTKNYVPCYVDTTTPMGKAVADSFGMDGSVGLVISDRSGKLQAFRHQGTLSADTLTSYLTQFADPNRVVTTTVVNPGFGQPSYYPPTGGLASGYTLVGGYTSAYTPVGGGGYGSAIGGAGYYPGGGCATCSSCSGGSCGRRRR